MKAFLKEFKDFIAKGNILDMAVGIIIGSAFTAIVTSLVEDIFTPIFGLLIPSSSFSEWTIAGFAVGNFLNAVVTFLLTAFVLFLILKVINKFKKPDEPAAPATKVCPYCKSDINIDATRCPCCTSKIEFTIEKKSE